MPEDLLREVCEAKGAAPRTLEPPAPATGAGDWARALARRGLAATDRLWLRLTPPPVRDAPQLLIFALHALCRDRAQLDDPLLASHQAACVDDLARLVETALGHGYGFVSPADIVAGLDPAGRHAMLTFDDGYRNNVLALEVLERFQVPATFFISSSHVLEGKSFWWDAVSRELRRAGVGEPGRRRQLHRLKAVPAAGIEAVLRHWFGEQALRPRGDADRPFTPGELAAFARHPLVHLGNHTADHVILTRCPSHEMRRQIADCQAALRDISGRAPLAIAYPNGDHSPAVAAAARAAGLRVGMTVRPARNRVPAPGDPSVMQLSRHYLQARPDPAWQFASCRCGFVPSRSVRRLWPGP